MLISEKIPLSYIIRKIRMEILSVTIIGVVVYYITHEFRDVIPHMPLSIPAFLGTAISVILSFKLNQSYDRWWEARKIWGNIVNDSRTLVMQLQSFVNKENEDAIRTMTLRQISWCYCLGQTLRGLNPLENLENYLSGEDLEKIEAHRNKPLAILQLNSQQIAELNKSEQIELFSHIQINNTIIRLTDAMGMAERIKNTIFPATYRLFLHLTIYLFVVTLSIALSDVKGYFEIPLLLIISSAFFLLERTASHLQDPFNNKPTDTPMTSISTTIEINLKQLIKEKKIPDPVLPETFYIL